MAIYAIIGIIAVVAVMTLLTDHGKGTQEPSISITSQVEESKQMAIERFQKQFCGVASKPNSNIYVAEIQLPNNCEMPLGVLVDTNNSKVWYVSTKNGSLGGYDFREQRFDKGHAIPLWKPRDNPIESSQVWAMKTDQNGGIWFTDEKQNSLWKYDTLAGNFEVFKIPAISESFGSIYPVLLTLTRMATCISWESDPLPFGLETRQKCQIIHIIALQKSLFLCKASKELIAI